jgi:anaerobic sulfite reductase subunit A
MANGMGTGDGIVHGQRLAMNKNRRLVYVFLSELYEKEVTLQRLKGLLDEGSPVLSIETSTELADEGLRKGFNMLSQYLGDARGRDLSQVKQELETEYANLFLGVKGKPPHPSESVYLSEDHAMYQEPWGRVLWSYRNAGVDKAKEYTEPEDHIAVELQFMAFLCRRTVEAMERDDKEEEKSLLQVQQDFINDHLAKWVPALTKDMLETANVDFYKGLAFITNAFIELDKNSVSYLIEKLVT